MPGFTVTQLEAIEAAIASGELVVQYDGKRIEYRSMTQLRQAREMIRGELVAAGLLADPAAAANARGGTTLAIFSRE